MEPSQKNLLDTWNATSELEDELVKWACPDPDQLPLLLTKYSSTTLKLEVSIATHLGYTGDAEMSLIKKEQAKMEEAAKHMDALQVMAAPRHESLRSADPGLEVLVKFTREMSALVSDFNDASPTPSPHAQHGDQRSDPDLEDKEVGIQYRIACIRRLLYKHRDEVRKLLAGDAGATADLDTLLDDKSMHIAYLQREIGWTNRVYVALLRRIHKVLALRADKMLKDCDGELEALKREIAASHAKPVEPPRADPWGTNGNPFEQWIEKDSVKDLGDKSELNYSGYGIGRFPNHDESWAILAKREPASPSTVTKLDLR